MGQPFNHEETTMATEAWLEAARNYNLLGDRERAKYWEQLTPEQQDALRDALASLQLGDTAAPAAIEQTPAPARRGCGGPLATGCLGMILGAVLTVGIEVAALMMGVQMVSDAIQGLSDESPSGGSATPGTSQPKESTDIDCKDPEQAAAHLYECDPERWCYENCKAQHPGGADH